MTNLDIFVIDYDISDTNSNWWFEIINIFLKSGEKFNATYDKNYISEIKKYLTGLNTFKISSENNLIEISGILNEEMILNFQKEYKPYLNYDIELYSLFYSLNIGYNYCSAHNGRQIFLSNLSSNILNKVENVIVPLSDFLRIDKS